MKKKESPEGLTFPPEVSRAIEQMQNAETVVAAYPWPEMEIGDAIFLQADQGETPESIRVSVEASVFQYSKDSGKKFSSKIISESNGVRVWRLE